MSTERNIQKIQVVWDGNVSEPIFVGDSRNVGVTAVGTGTLSIRASKDTELVDFGVASTINNSYATVVIADETLTTSNYVTSLAVAGSTKIGEINTNLVSWIALVRSSSAVDAFITVTDNQ